MARRSEQGNVLGFVLVGALLVALLLGGIYVVRHNVTKQDGGVNVASDEANDTEKQNNESKNDSNASSSGSTTEGSSTSGNGGSDNDSLQNALNSQSSSQQNGSPAKDSSAGAASTATGKLPETGPADTAVSVAGATLLVGAAVSYARSRRVL